MASASVEAEDDADAIVHANRINDGDLVLEPFAYLMTAATRWASEVVLDTPLGERLV